MEGIEEHGRQLGVRAEAGYDLDVGGKGVPTLVNRGGEEGGWSTSTAWWGGGGG